MITVLLAAYNGERFLPAQLDSLSAQTETDFQVLFQDDGSADRTPEILAEAARRDPRFVPAQEQGRHLGAVGNFLSLLRQAEGDLIMFCDQDDVWEPDKIQTLARAMRDAAADAGEIPLMVHSDAVIIDENGQVTEPSFFRLQGWDPGAVTLNRLLVQNNATGCMMMLNRPLADLVVRHGDPEKMFMHDWFIALTAAAFGRIVFVDRPLTRYRQHGENAVGASRATLIERGRKALREGDRARDRIALTYSHTRAFREAYGDALPGEAADLADRYLATEKMPKPERLRAIRRLGCTMQSPVTRLGQIHFG